MSLGPSHSSPDRWKIGLMFLVMGIILLIWAWGNWIYRSSNGVGESAIALEPAGTARSPASMQAIKASPFALMVGLFLVLVFLVGSYAIVRGSRRLRQALLHEKPPATASSDVWSTHKPPSFDSGEEA